MPHTSLLRFALSPFSPCRGELRAEGWLVLKENSLCFHDRNPALSSRRPRYSFTFGSPETALVVIPIVNRSHLPMAKCPPKLHLAFGIESYLPNRTESVVFFAANIESKLDWVAKIREVLEQISQRLSTPSATSGASQSGSSGVRACDLKPVSVSLVRTPLASCGSGGGGGGGGGGAWEGDTSVLPAMVGSPSSVN